MSEKELISQLELLGLTKDDYSIKLSNQFAEFHLVYKRINCWEIYQKEQDRFGIYFSREFDDIESARKGMVDLVRILKGILPLYSLIDSKEKFDERKHNILSSIEQNENNNKIINLLFQSNYNDLKTINKVKDYLMNNGFDFERKIFEKIYTFINSIK